MYSVKQMIKLILFRRRMVALAFSSLKHLFAHAFLVVRCFLFYYYFIDFIVLVRQTINILLPSYITAAHAFIKVPDLFVQLLLSLLSLLFLVSNYCLTLRGWKNCIKPQLVAMVT